MEKVTVRRIAQTVLSLLVLSLCGTVFAQDEFCSSYSEAEDGEWYNGHRDAVWRWILKKQYYEYEDFSDACIEKSWDAAHVASPVGLIMTMLGESGVPAEHIQVNMHDDHGLAYRTVDDTRDIVASCDIVIFDTFSSESDVVCRIRQFWMLKDEQDGWEVGRSYLVADLDTETLSQVRREIEQSQVFQPLVRIVDDNSTDGERKEEPDTN